MPTFLRAYAVPFQSEFRAFNGVYYLQFRSNEVEPGHPIGDFVERVKPAVTATQPRVVVIDLGSIRPETSRQPPG